jgi:hypothetical protein
MVAIALTSWLADDRARLGTGAGLLRPVVRSIRLSNRIGCGRVLSEFGQPLGKRDSELQPKGERRGGAVLLSEP